MSTQQDTPTSPTAAEPTPPETTSGREALGLLLALVLLTVVYYHGDPRGWGLAGPDNPALGQWLQRYSRFVWFGLNFVLLFGVPALVIRVGWRERLSDYGLGLGQPRLWDLLAPALLMIPVVVWASRLPSLQAYYPLVPLAREGVGGFLLSATGWLVYFFAWEFFFRGFLLHLLLRRGPALAILVQTIPFVMMHYGKPEAESWGAILAGLALGFMAWRGRSMLSCWLLHWAVAVSLDLLVVVWRL